MHKNDIFLRKTYLCRAKRLFRMRHNLNTYGTWLAGLTGCKTQKISINAGFTCPNRDGTLGTTGCSYCNNQTFNPAYCQPTKTITQQLEEGKEFFGRKYPDMKYLAYFQAYTNTYGTFEVLRQKYEEALAVPDVVGLVIGTRPDCMPDCLLDYLQELSLRYTVIVEYGLESTYDSTLQRIRRGHTHAQSVDAIQRTAARGILVGVHIILGLPGETREMILQEADTLSALPINTLKIHQLQLIKGTLMAEEYAVQPADFHLYSVEEYIGLLCDFIPRLRTDIVLERFVSQSPASLLATPGWGLKNHEFTARLQQALSLSAMS